MEKPNGYVYILTNPSFREDWVKIGKSSRPVDVRSKELDNTAVPLPFEIYATLKTSKFDKVEKQIHKQIDRLTDLRIRQNREFFNIAPSVALDIMRDIADVLLLKDIEVPELSSPSALAIFCCGSSRNGTTSWEDANGNTYDKEWWLGKNKEVKIENPKVANDK